MKKLFALILALCMVMSLAACSSKTEAPTASTPNSSQDVKTDTPPAAAAQGRTHMNVGFAAEVTSLDPSMSPDCVTPTGYGYTVQLFETLLRYDSTAGEYIPELATDWSFNEDSTEVTFTLKQGVKFHNGDVMTADDVLFSLTRALESPYTSSVNGSIDHFEKVDDSHVKVVLKYPYVPILQVLDVPCWSIVSKRAVEELGDDFGRHPVGTGAYMLKEWLSGQRLEYVAFDDYHGDAPAIKSVTIIILPDQTAASLALEEGSIDFNQGIPKTDLAYMESLDNISVMYCTGGQVCDISMNCTDGIFADKRVRQAVALAIDLDEILIGGAEGYGQTANVLCAPIAGGYCNDIAPIQQDLEKAKALLAEAGYPNGVDVVMDQDSSDTYMRTAEIIQAQLKKIGINITFNKMERSAWFDIVGDKREFSITHRMTTMSVLDADYILTRRLSKESLGSGNNYTGYWSDELEALIQAGRQESDPEKRHEIYHQAYLIIQDECPIIPLYYYQTAICYDAKLNGVQGSSTNRDLWRMMWFEA